MKWLASGLVSFALAFGVLVLLLWAYNLRQDRKHIVVAKSQTPVFAEAANGTCGGTRLATIQAGTTLRVQRIRYWKNCATLDVALSDGRLGHIVFGEGEVSIIPPLKPYE